MITACGEALVGGSTTDLEVGHRREFADGGVPPSRSSGQRIRVAPIIARPATATGGGPSLEHERHGTFGHRSVVEEPESLQHAADGLVRLLRDRHDRLVGLAAHELLTRQVDRLEAGHPRARGREGEPLDPETEAERAADVRHALGEVQWVARVGPPEINPR